MLSFFPDPYPDELLYSIIARYHVRSGNIHFIQSMNDLFSPKNKEKDLISAYNIRYLIENLSSVSNLTEYNLIYDHTLFPFYMAFDNKDEITSNFKEITDGFFYRIYNMCFFGSLKVLRYCPVCNKESEIKYGEYYWHRKHNIKDVYICPIHHIRLLDSNDYNTIRKINIIIANKKNCPENKKADYDLKNGYENFKNLSIDCLWILDNFYLIRKLIDVDLFLNKKYSMILFAKGYIVDDRKIHINSFISDFSHYYDFDFYRMMGLNVSPMDYNSIFQCLPKYRFNNEIELFDTIKHLLLIRFLNGNLQDFFSYSNRHKYFNKHLYNYYDRYRQFLNSSDRNPVFSK